MNFSKYSTTHLSSNPQFTQLNSSMNCGSSSMKRQASGNNRQEQSVERLKTCIADLKKLASNKVKRGPNKDPDYEPSFGNNSQTHKHDYDSRHKDKYSSQTAASRSKQKPSSGGGTHDRKQHQTKIANALKKYIGDAEQTPPTGHSSNPKDSNRRESQRGRSGSNKKRTSHQREASYSKKDSSYLNGSGKRQSSKTSLTQNKKLLENSMKQATNRVDSYAMKPARKAQSQERIPQSSDRGSAAYLQAHSSTKQNSNGKQHRSASQSNYMNRVQSSSSKKPEPVPHAYIESQNIPISQSSKIIMSQKYQPQSTTGAMNKERKPFTFNNYMLNQSDLGSSGYKKSSSSGPQGQKENAIDIRINSNKEGKHDYIVVQSPQQKEAQNYLNSDISQPKNRRQDSRSSDQHICRQNAGPGTYCLPQSMGGKVRPETSHFGPPAFDTHLNYKSSSKVKEDARAKSSHNQAKQPLHVVNIIDQREGGIRSLQEAANLTQSTDFSENRIQSLDQKRILSLQSNTNNASQIQQQFQNNSIYSIQQANNQIIGPSSLSIAQNNITYGGPGTTVGPFMRTHVTREDFNLEDLHSQIVYKIQRAKQLVKEIEALPVERDPPSSDFSEEVEQFYSGLKGDRRGSNNRSNSKQRHTGGFQPQSLILCTDDEVIGYDGCTKKAINFGRK